MWALTLCPCPSSRGPEQWGHWHLESAHTSSEGQFLNFQEFFKAVVKHSHYGN